MAKKEERFEVTFRDGSWLKDEGIRQIKQHGWNWNRNMSGYIFWHIWQSYFFKKR